MDSPIQCSGGFYGLKLAGEDYDLMQDRGYPSRRGLGSSGPRLFFTRPKLSYVHGGPQAPDLAELDGVR